MFFYTSESHQFKNGSHSSETSTVYQKKQITWFQNQLGN